MNVLSGLKAIHKGWVMKEFKPDYTKYKTWFKVEDVDAIMKAYITAESAWNKFSLLVRLVMFFGWYFIRSRMIDHQLMIEKQEYEKTQHGNDGNDVEV